MKLRNHFVAIYSLFISLAFLAGNLTYALEIDDYPVLQELVATMTSEDGYPKEELVKLLSSVTINDKTLELMDKQWEALPWHKYRKLFINENRINLGVKFWNTYDKLLRRAEQEYGVPPEVIVALIGVETHYGTRMGDRSVLTSLATLSAAYPRRSKFFTAELRTFLNMTRKEGIAADSVVGSFAGAIGIPQFMPSSYKAYSVDFNGNGKRDLVNETADAIGSVANYLAVHGYTANQAIFAPVNSALPDEAKNWVSKKAKLNYYRDGFVDAGIDFNPANGSDKAALVSLTMEENKAYFIAYKNFYAITRYNPSTNYAMAVTQLSQEISANR